MYRIYASKSNSDVSRDTLVPYQCYERDETAKRCIELFRKGYTVHKVVLPNDTEIRGDDIERALKEGIDSIQVALTGSYGPRVRNRRAGHEYIGPLEPLAQRILTESVSGLTVTAAGEQERLDWNAFVAASAGAELYHDYRWRPLIESVFGHECRYFIARDAAARVHGVLPLVRLRSRLFGDFLVSVPFFNYGGILADSHAGEVALRNAAVGFARELGVSHVELRHRDRQVSDWPAREDKVSMLLSLPKTKDALFKSFDSKLRAQIRRPQKAGATCRSGGAELLSDFYAVFAHNMRDLGTPVYSRRLFAEILLSFPQEARLFVVDLRGRPVAAGFVLTHRGTMEIPWAASLRDANRDSVNMLLYWSALQHAVELGCQRFDFGRSSKESGTFRFKEQWGAKPQQLRWHYWLRDGGAVPQITPHNPKYRLAIALWKKLPLPAANLLGPPIVRNLP